MNGAFVQCRSIEEIDLSNVGTSGTAINYNDCFHTWGGTAKTKVITFADGIKPTTFKTALLGQSALTTINGDLDFSSCTNMAFGRTSGTALTINGTWSNIKTSVSGLYGLDHDSAVMIINGLTDLTGSTAQTLTLPSALESEMTESEIEIATNKNWTVAFG